MNNENKDMFKEHIEALKHEIEQASNRRPHTPKDFEYIAQLIGDKTRENISKTTLMRMWNYVRETSKTRLYTLDVLSRYLNYTDFSAFQEYYEHINEESNMLMSTHLRAKNMGLGVQIELKWNPNRRCIIEHKGNHDFEVILSENSKLEKGARFSCSHFIQCQPLYIFDLEQQGNVFDSFVIGSKNGITELKLIKE